MNKEIDPLARWRHDRNSHRERLEPRNGGSGWRRRRNDDFFAASVEEMDPRVY